LLWPESAAWPYRFDRDAVFQRAVRSLADEGCSVLLNSPYEAAGELFNSAYLLQPGGSVQRYDKRHLVPYGEYVPLKRLLPFVGKLARNAGDFSPAPRLRFLDWGEERLGMAICFEIIFPSEVALAVRRGASLLVAVSNDAWYGDTAAPWQHFRAARFRAAENRRPLLRAAITGVSGIVAADGSLQARLGPFEQGVLRAEMRGRTDLSPYTRRPWLVPLFCFAATLLGLVRGRPAGTPAASEGDDSAWRWRC
jgi:apolipoprotein N-acyltransferase